MTPVMLRCSRCRQTRPTTAFFVRRARRRGFSSECKACYKDTREYRDLEERRDRTLRRRYGISAAEYDALDAAQGGLCAICRKSNGGRGRLAVDHDHATGAVRGLLCFRCNTTLGLVERIGLTRVAAYLSRSLERAA